MSLALHIGAHKTATTHLQTALRLNVVELAGAGVLAPGLGEVRREATARLSVAPGAASAWLDRLATKGARRIVISDENLPGRIGSLMRGGPLYPAAARRLAPFAARGDVEVFLTVRSYDQFWRSVWLESLRHRGWLDWEAFAASIEHDRARWPGLVARLIRLFGEERVTVWDYAGYRAGWEARFVRLCGGAAPRVAPPAETRPSLSAEAVAVLAREAAGLSSTEQARRARELALELPASPDRPPFRPFPRDEAARLAALHERDLAEIRARFPRLGT